MDITKLDETGSINIRKTAEELTDRKTPDLAGPSTETLEEGELYVLRKGYLEHVPRNADDGMRRVRITEDAYQVAMDVGRAMRKELNGYKPDVSLVTSALLLNHTDDGQKAQDIVKQFVIRMFSQDPS